MLKRLGRTLKGALLASPLVRRHLAFQIKHDHFADLDLLIPMSHNFVCPVRRSDALLSFSEIFVQGEYDELWKHMALPARWIDLGCHAGYFTLYLAWKRARAALNGDWSALLVDADPRALDTSRVTLALNGIDQQCNLQHRMIAAGGSVQPFALRHGMVSSADLKEDGAESVTEVRVLEPREILEALKPPYDLIKVDIEGGEWDFLSAYGEVCGVANHIVLEWHSHDEREDIEGKLRTGFEPLEFHHVTSLKCDKATDGRGRFYSTGVELYRRVDVKQREVSNASFGG